MLTCDLTTLAPDIAGFETLCADRPFERSCKIHQDIFLSNATVWYSR